MPFAAELDDSARSLLDAVTEAEHVQQLGDAIGRLHSFAVLHGPGEIIDDTSGLATEDLALLLGVLEKIKAITSAGRKLRPAS